MDKRLLQRVRVVHGVPAGTTTSGATAVTSALIDRLNADGSMARSALINLNHGAQEVGTVKLTPTLIEGESDTPATAVTLKTALPEIACTAVGTNLFQINLEGMARYFKVVITPAVTASGVVDVSADVILGDMDHNPESTPAVVYEKSA